MSMFNTPGPQKTDAEQTPRAFAQLGSSFKAFGSQLKAQTEKLSEKAAETFQTPAGSEGPGAGKDGVPEKEELMQLCMKMSKKVKNLQAQKKDLTEIVKSQVQSQTDFVNFYTQEVVMTVDMSTFGDPMTSTPPNPNSTVKPPPSINVKALKDAWRSADEQRGLMMQDMQREIQNVVAKHQAEMCALEKKHEEQLQLQSVFGGSDSQSLRDNVAPSPPPSERSKAEVAQLNTTIEALNDKLAKVQAAAKKEKDSGDATETKLKQVQAEAEKSKAAHSQAVAALEQTKASLADAQKSLEAAKSENATLSKQLTSTKETTVSADELTKFQKAHKETLESFTDLQQSSATEISILTNHLSQAKQAATAATSELSSSKTKFQADIDEKDSKISALNQSITAAQQALASSDESLKKISAELKAARDDVELKQKQVTSAASKFKNFEEQSATEKMTMSNSVSNLTSELASLKEINESLNESVQSKETSEGEQTAALRKSMADMQKSHEAAVSKFKDQSAQLQARIKELTDLHSESTKKLRDDFAAAGKEKDEALAVAKSDFAKVQEEVKASKASLESLKASHLQEVKKLQARAEDGGKSASSAQAEIAKLKDVVEGLEAKIKAAEDLVAKGQRLLEDQVKDLEAAGEKEKAMGEKLTALTKARGGDEEEIKKLKGALKFEIVKFKDGQEREEKLKAENAAATARLEALKEEISASSGISEQVTELNGQVETLSKSLKVSEAEAEKLKGALKFEIVKFKDGQEREEKLKAENAAATARLEALKEEISASSGISEQVANLTERLTSSEAEAEKMRAAVAEKTAEAERLTGVTAALKQRLAQMAEEKQRDVSEHEEELKRIQADQSNEASFVQNEIKSKSEENKRLSDKLKEIMVVEESSKKALQAVESALSQKENELVEVRVELEGMQKAKALADSKVGDTQKLNADLSSLRNSEKKYEEINATLTTENVRLTGLVQRLQSDAESAEVKYGQRTALVGVLESELSEAKAKVKAFEDKFKSSEEDSERLTQESTTAKEEVKRLEGELATEKAKVEAAVKEGKAKAEKAQAMTEKKMAAELEKVRKDMNKKSLAAQELYKTQETQYKSLLEEKNKLQDEVDSGSASDRKIFELASKQSNREASIAAEVEARDLAVQRMIETLVGRDSEMADMEVKYEEIKKQLDDYSRASRRNDVNVDYLKGVLVKYLSLPTGSSERKSLLSVIATLLQFGPEDYATIEDGYKQTSWFWGAIAPKEIGVKGGGGGVGVSGGGGGQVRTPPNSKASAPKVAAAAAAPAPGGIGEVKVAGLTKAVAPDQQESRRKRTSMQF
ncbi:hypothetical protein TrVE_jg7294 [Triparma verrucosa]|uniref:GRIP domain-containing protein n=1 Tax=Triparma verrucosa TaxID=1606542 RepID=A0A9W7CA19_9STRA|nr:hypothetical protein TrVE_jg7294 [Triparma verrucosa]